jgi:hypothetical protein
MLGGGDSHPPPLAPPSYAYASRSNLQSRADRPLTSRVVPSTTSLYHARFSIRDLTVKVPGIRNPVSHGGLI